MSEETKKSRHVALEQLKLMLDFVAQHPDIATGTRRTLEARHASKALWCQLTKTLNSTRGARKTHVGWSKYWSDFKNKLKNKVAEKKRRKPGSKKPYTKLEKQALAILGPDFNKKQAKDNGFDNAHCAPLPTEIKQESMLETTLMSNGHYNLINGNDRLLGLQSEGSTSSDEDCVEDEDINSEEPLLNSIYPKWLMEIEQKRADAELSRAKAEELRAEVASKAVEASLIQAEALRKLAEAAERQADSIQRIAMVMENKQGLQDHILPRHMPGYQ